KQLSYPKYKFGSNKELDSLKKDCEKLSVKCVVHKGDVRSDRDVTKAVKATHKAFGKIDILFNNAGICAYGLTHELTEDAWDSMLDINLKGPWMVARRIIPVMIK